MCIVANKKDEKNLPKSIPKLGLGKKGGRLYLLRLPKALTHVAKMIGNGKIISRAKNMFLVFRNA